jgi:hypothetical protein
MGDRSTSALYSMAAPYRPTGPPSANAKPGGSTAPANPTSNGAGAPANVAAVPNHVSAAAAAAAAAAAGGRPPTQADLLSLLSRASGKLSEKIFVDWFIFIVYFFLFRFSFWFFVFLSLWKIVFFFFFFFFFLTTTYNTQVLLLINLMFVLL